MARPQFIQNAIEKKIQSQTAIVLCYHEIERGVQFPSWKFSVTDHAFKDQLKFLSDRGFSFVTIDALLQADTTDKNNKLCAICFDDCCTGTMDAADMLGEYGGHATWYAITRHIANRFESARKSDRGHLTLAQLKELEKRGHQIGSHSVSHRNLELLSETEIETEITDSKQDLEQQLGHEVTSFCYPFGRYNMTALRCVEAAGYRNATALLGPKLNTAKPQFEIARSVIRAKDDYALFMNKIAHCGTKTNAFTPWADWATSFIS